MSPHSYPLWGVLYIIWGIILNREHCRDIAAPRCLFAHGWLNGIACYNIYMYIVMSVEMWPRYVSRKLRIVSPKNAGKTIAPEQFVSQLFDPPPTI